ncbi:MAG: hypothetical protein U5K69_21455 [Balneolaceae bacterium]|nr:hypothetical protein [Balneolaceae bacterium]
MVAAVFGGLASNVPQFYYLFILPVIFAFQNFENYQKRLLRSFSSRIQEIEESFNSNPRVNFDHPQISRVSIEALKVKNEGKIIKKRPIKDRIYNYWRRIVSRLAKLFNHPFQRFVELKPHRFFYSIMYLIVVGVFLIELFNCYLKSAGNIKKEPKKLLNRLYSGFFGSEVFIYLGETTH